jgi:hypothetical protein
LTAGATVRADEGDLEGSRREQSYGTIIIVGGGCYGAYYVQQLRRARDRSALMYDRLVVVDRDPACRVTTFPGADLEVRAVEWRAFFRGYLAHEARDGDAVVPSPLMPHLLFQWLEERAVEQWPERRVFSQAPAEVGGIPWQREGRDATRYLSFATWTCPVNCIEPRICPHTRGERTWSMPPALTQHVQTSDDGSAVRASAIFHCTHRAYGVGMIDVSDVLAAERTLLAAGRDGRASMLVGTVSHCHGAIGILAIE